MSKINDGGPAFPGGELVFDGGDCKTPYNAGMTLRDWYAGQALAGLLAREDYYTNMAAERAYQMADAMLAERAKAEGRTDG